MFFLRCLACVLFIYMVSINIDGDGDPAVFASNVKQMVTDGWAFVAAESQES